MRGRKKPRFVSSRRKVSSALHTRKRATFWCVSNRVMQQWKAKGVPVDDVPAMIAWYSALSKASQEKLTASFRKRLLELRTEIERKGGAAVSDPDFDQFSKEYVPKQTDEKDTMGAMRRQLAFYIFKLERAQQRNDAAGASEATKQLTYFANVIHDAEIRAQRLGRDVGDLYSGDEVDRVFKAVGFWLMSGADSMIAQLAKGLEEAAAAGSLNREAVRKVVEPVVMVDRVLAPLARSAKIKCGASLPRRFTEALRAGCAAVLEDGGRAFDELYGEPAQVVPFVAREKIIS